MTHHRHSTTLSISYADQRLARTVADALAVEVDQIDDDRSRATVECHTREVGDVPDSDAREIGDVPDSDARAVGGVPDSDARNAQTDEVTTVRVTVTASDLTALRAGINTWTRLVDVAESVSAAAEE